MTAESNIQGYIPTLTNHKSGKPVVRYVAFKGGLTKNFLEAFCVPEIPEAFAIARRHQKTLWDLPGATPVDNNCELVPKEPVIARTA